MASNTVLTTSASTLNPVNNFTVEVTDNIGIIVLYVTPSIRSNICTFYFSNTMRGIYLSCSVQTKNTVIFSFKAANNSTQIISLPPGSPTTLTLQIPNAANTTDTVTMNIALNQGLGTFTFTGAKSPLAMTSLESMGNLTEFSVLFQYGSTSVTEVSVPAPVAAPKITYSGAAPTSLSQIKALKGTADLTSKYKGVMLPPAITNPVNPSKSNIWNTYVTSWDMYDPAPYDLSPAQCNLTPYDQVTYAFVVISSTFEVCDYASNDPQS